MRIARLSTLPSESLGVVATTLLATEVDKIASVQADVVIESSGNHTGLAAPSGAQRRDARVLTARDYS